MNLRIVVLITFFALLIIAVAWFRLAQSGAQTLWDWSRGGKWLLPLVAISALIDSMNPCAFSMLILTIAFLFSIGQLRSAVLKVGSAYIFGIFLAYILIGLGILQVLHIFDTPHFMAKVGATLLVVLGAINIVNELYPAFPIKLRIPHAAHHAMADLMKKGSLPTAFLLGGLVGLCEFPCTGGPYLMILGLLHDRGTYLTGFGYLILYNLIFILPLAVILLISSDKRLVEKVNMWQKSKRKLMRLGGGIAMVLLGIVIFFL